jgi:hypothetical protein
MLLRQQPRAADSSSSSRAGVSSESSMQCSSAIQKLWSTTSFNIQLLCCIPLQSQQAPATQRSSASSTLSR